MTPEEPESVRAVAEYYAARAAEYDMTAGYEDPVAEPLRAAAKVRCQELFRDEDVLEIACETRYWTEVVAQVANSVLATDACEGMLTIARKRLAAYKNVQSRSPMHTHWKACAAASMRPARSGGGRTFRRA